MEDSSQHEALPLPIRINEDRATPRANPNFDIFFSDGKIKSVVERCLPGVKQDQMNIEHLPTGKSFNNRIYFINLSEPVLTTRPEWKNSDVDVDRSKTQIQSSFLVLKIAGHPFGRTKVQNEVACLLLLEKYCPSIPCPKLIAWSDDGKKIRTPQFPRGFRDTEPKDVPVLAIQAEDGTPMENVRKDTEGQGWMLITREPGRPINNDDLSGKAGDELMRQIAAHVATWRTNMPSAKATGNLRIAAKNSKPSPAGLLYDKAILPGYEVHIDSLITQTAPSSALTSTEKYYALLFKNALKKLKDKQLLQYLSDEVYNIVKQFMDNTFPKLPIFRGTDQMVFTHNDLSARNVLAAPNASGGVNVSAVIDFEFAGFFPMYEEFAGHMQNDNEEWALKKWSVFLTELNKRNALPEAIAANIPAPSAVGNHPDKCFEFGTDEFHQATLLSRASINAAPWFIKEEKDYAKGELKKELNAAKARVENAITLLEGMVPDTPEKRSRRSTVSSIHSTPRN